MLPLQIASEYVCIFMPFTQLMIIFTISNKVCNVANLKD